jgi:hypothetical protein
MLGAWIFFAAWTFGGWTSGVLTVGRWILRGCAFGAVDFGLIDFGSGMAFRAPATALTEATGSVVPMRSTDPASARAA